MVTPTSSIRINKAFAFNSKNEGNTINLWRADVEGGQPHQLTFDKEFAGFPSWSRDGKFLSFELKRGEDENVAIIPSQGGEVQQLTFDHGQSWPYNWSNDNDKIIFVAYRNHAWNVWSVSRSTKQQKQLTSYTKENEYVRYPTISPHDDKIVYEYAKTTSKIMMIEN